MSNLTRAIKRPSPAKTRVLLVRQPAKSVRPSDQASRLPTRLLIGVIAGVGGIGLIWLMGHLGYRLGFASLMGLPELLGEPGGGLATGAMILIWTPVRIVEAGMSDTLWLMLSFVMIGMAGGCLAAIRPIAPGGPKPTQSAVVYMHLGAAAAGIAAAFIVAYVVSPTRTAWLSPLPREITAMEDWITGLHAAAGIDVLVAVGGGLWVVFAMRLPVPAWLRALTTSLCMTAFVIVVIAMSMSTAAAAHISSPRSLCTFNGSTQPRMLLGYTPQHAAVLSVEEGRARILFFNSLIDAEVTGRESIADFLAAAAATPTE